MVTYPSKLWFYLFSVTTHNGTDSIGDLDSVSYTESRRVSHVCHSAGDRTLSVGLLALNDPIVIHVTRKLKVALLN